MFARFIVAVSGVVAMLAGLALVFAPRATWRVAENMIALPPGGTMPSHFYVVGAVTAVWGIVLVYAGALRLTYYSIFVTIIGLIVGLSGLIFLVAPGSLIHVARSMFFDRPERTMLMLSYVGGIIRVIVGYFLLIAALKPRPSSRDAR